MIQSNLYKNDSKRPRSHSRMETMRNKKWNNNKKKWVKAIMIFTLAINQGILLKTELLNDKIRSNSL